MMMPEIISAISGGKYRVGRKLPPTEMWEMNKEEKSVPIGWEDASSAVAMPLNPMAGRVVVFSGFHSAPPDRYSSPAPKPASAPAMVMERMMFFFSLMPA